MRKHTEQHQECRLIQRLGVNPDILAHVLLAVSYIVKRATTMQYVHATDEGKRRAVEAVEKTHKPVASSFPVTIRTQNEKRRSA